jgi:hypothetical protein
MGSAPSTIIIIIIIARHRSTRPDGVFQLARDKEPKLFKRKTKRNKEKFLRLYNIRTTICFHSNVHMNRPIRYWHTSISMYIYLLPLRNKKFVLLRLNTDCCILVTRFQKAD